MANFLYHRPLVVRWYGVGRRSFNPLVDNEYLYNLFITSIAVGGFTIIIENRYQQQSSCNSIMKICNFGKWLAKEIDGSKHDGTSSNMVGSVVGKFHMMHLLHILTKWGTSLLTVKFLHQVARNFSVKSWAVGWLTTKCHLLKPPTPLLIFP